MVEKQNNKEVSSSVQIICKKLDTERQKNLIETSKIESLHEKLIDNGKKGKVKEMVERIESQQTNSKDETLRKGLDIGKDRVSSSFFFFFFVSNMIYIYIYIYIYIK